MDQVWLKIKKYIKNGVNSQTCNATLTRLKINMWLDNVKWWSSREEYI